MEEMLIMFKIGIVIKKGIVVETVSTKTLKEMLIFLKIQGLFKR